jgi:hypothetical protein
MFDFELELKRDLERIEKAVPTPPDWRKTRIGNNQGGIVADVERLSNPGWWRKPSNQAEQSLTALLNRAGLGSLTDTTEAFIRKRDRQKEKNESYEESTSAAEIAERQRDRAQRRREGAVTDEGEYAKYFPEANDNAWAWADALATKLDTNTPESRPWYSALLSYIHKFPQKTKASDLGQETVAKLVKQICDGGHHE